MVYVYLLPDAKAQIPTVKWRDDFPPNMPLAIGRHEEEITPADPLPHCRVFRAPRLGPEYLYDYYIPDASYLETIPDIFTVGIPFISEKVRDVIVERDDFDHTFTPFYMKDNSNDEKELTEKLFYHFHIRRRIEIEETGFEARVGFEVSTLDYPIGTIQNVPELYDGLEMYPIWQIGVSVNHIFMSNKLVEVLSEAGINNFDGKPPWPCLWEIYPE